MAEKKKSGKKSAVPPEPKKRGLFKRLVRAALILAIPTAIVIAVLSVSMREKVIKQLKTRTTASSSVVYSRAYPLQTGLISGPDRLVERLKRTGFQQVEEPPGFAGEFRLIGGKKIDKPDKAKLHPVNVEEPENPGPAARLEVALRSFLLPTGEEQPEKKIAIEFSGPEIKAIRDFDTGKPIERVWLQPELLSVLGESSTRVSTHKRLDQYPQQLIDAVLSIEDERFYGHFGIDPIGILRALIVNLQSGQIAQGGSTITQQLAKNLFLDPQRNFKRKIEEAMSAILIETAFTKDQILEFYLNEVFLGQEGRFAIHGFGEAAKSFFGHEVEGISLSEAATLAGMIQAPTKYSPRRFPDNARERRNTVLAKMEQRGKITAAERAAAEKEKIETSPPQHSVRTAPYFVDYLRKRIPEVAGEDLVEHPVSVYTGIEYDYQACADKAVQDGLSSLEKKYSRLRRKSGPLQAALVSISPVDGEIRAWVGGRNYSQNQFDRVSQAQRQPGSAFKPFVYLTALDPSLNSYRVARTTSLLSDEPVTLEIPGSEPWTPQNYDRKYRGEVTVREALSKSLNIPTVDLAMKVGVGSIAKTAELFGFGDNLPKVPSLALGAGEVSPLVISRAYAAIANGGNLIDLVPLTSVVSSSNNRVLFQRSFAEQRVVSESATYILTDILETVLISGTATIVRQLGFTRPAAGKTGTTNDGRDAWFIGFTPSHLATVWVGFDDNSQIGLTGAQAAAPIWTEYMKCISAWEPDLAFVVPPGVVRERIDATTGLLATTQCNPADIVDEVFIEGTQPVTTCNRHGAGTEPYDEQLDEPPIAPAGPQYPYPDARPSRTRDDHNSWWDKWWR